MLTTYQSAFPDTKVQLMLEQIVRNPIETPRGYKNPDNGIALRGPLSQFFSALYLKPLDDAFDTLDVTYLRYQDDIIILRHTTWSRWWVRTSQVWSHQTLLIQFIRSCYDPQIAGIGAEILLINLRRMDQPAGMMAQPDWQEPV